MAQSKGSSAHNSLDHFYSGSVSGSGTVTQVFTGKGNIFGFLFENNSATADVYIRFFNAASTGDVTDGTTTPVATYRVPAGAVFGKDAQNFSLDFFSLGCQITVGSTRTGVSSTTAPTVHVWYWNK